MQLKKQLMGFLSIGLMLFGLASCDSINVINNVSDTVSTEPNDSTPSAEPNDSTPSVEPNDSTPSAEPNDSTPSTEPKTDDTQSDLDYEVINKAIDDTSSWNLQYPSGIDGGGIRTSVLSLIAQNGDNKYLKYYEDHMEFELSTNDKGKTANGGGVRAELYEKTYKYDASKCYDYHYEFKLNSSDLKNTSVTIGQFLRRGNQADRPFLQFGAGTKLYKDGLKTGYHLTIKVYNPITVNNEKVNMDKQISYFLGNLVNDQLVRIHIRLYDGVLAVYRDDKLTVTYNMTENAVTCISKYGFYPKVGLYGSDNDDVFLKLNLKNVDFNEYVPTKKIEMPSNKLVDDVSKWNVSYPNGSGGFINTSLANVGDISYIKYNNYVLKFRSNYSNDMDSAVNLIGENFKAEEFDFSFNYSLFSSIKKETKITICKLMTAESSNQPFITIYSVPYIDSNGSYTHYEIFAKISLSDGTNSNEFLSSLGYVPVNGGYSNININMKNNKINIIMDDNNSYTVDITDYIDALKNGIYPMLGINFNSGITEEPEINLLFSNIKIDIKK